MAAILADRPHERDEITLIVNVPTELYNYSEPDEYRLPAHTDQIPYDWSRQDG